MTISLRKAAESDARMVFSWRNHEAVRKASLDTETIAWEMHQSWFLASLEMDGRSLLVAEDGGAPVGVIRFDISEGHAEISLFLDPLRMGHGLGFSLLQAGIAWAKSNLTELKALRAKIKPDNLASIKTFEKSGFEELWRVYELKL